jgi:hypothetical protein
MFNFRALAFFTAAAMLPDEPANATTIVLAWAKLPP